VDTEPFKLDYLQPKRTRRPFFGPNWFVVLAVPGGLFWIDVFLLYLQSLLPMGARFNVVLTAIAIGAFVFFFLAFLCAVFSLLAFYFNPPRSRPIYSVLCVLIHLSIFGLIIYFKIYVGQVMP